MEPSDAIRAEPTQSPAPPSTTGPSRRRITAFRVLAGIPAIFFLVAELHLLAPWTVILPMDEPRPELNEWFYVVSACADLFMLVSIAGLIVKPRLTGLAAWVVAAGVIVLVTIGPLQPLFLIVVAVLLGPAAIAYPYRGDLRQWRAWWADVYKPLLALAAAVAVVLIVLAVVAFRRQLVNDDAAADANWWNDYAEHTADLALVGLLAASRAPGALLLRGALSAVYLYLGAIAIFVIPDAVASWGVGGGVIAVALGVAFGYGTWLGLGDGEAPRLPGQRRRSGAEGQT